MYQLEDTYWWFVARRVIVRDLLARYRFLGDLERRPRLLDVGCGTGASLKALAEFGEVVGVDRSREALQFCRQRAPYRLALALGEALPVADDSVEVITALDLLEHIQDDAAAVRDFARALRPGGVLLVTVPACPLLWSEHDEALDHLRRYRAARLRRILQESGLRVERLSPLIATLLLPIAALRLLQRLRRRHGSEPKTALIEPPAFVNTALIWLLRLEGKWLLRANLPVGVSLMAVARKPQGAAEGKGGRRRA
jgi:SAM-dependent methyltransferase